MPDPAHAEVSETSLPPVLSTRELAVRIGERWIVKNINLQVQARQVLGLIGPSGVGKSTLLKCLNRLVDLTPGLALSGDVLLHGRSIRGQDIHADDLRAKVGMLFQQPVVFPKTIYKNVIFGVRHLGSVPKREWPAVAEQALVEAALWDEVKDRLHDAAATLSVGQQQRLCLARTLAAGPEVILMDEPTSALDPRSTQAIEELIGRLKSRHTIVLVTHNIAQARRVADELVCLCLLDGAGQIAETGRCSEVLDHPKSPQAIKYLEQSPG